jgi:pyruvate,water dikinase
MCRMTRPARAVHIFRHLSQLALALLTVAPIVGCSDSDKADPAPMPRPEVCVVPAGAAAPDFVKSIGCRADFDALASAPLDASIPGARSVKFVVDLLEMEGDPLYFQNSTKYKIHWDFASKHLSGSGKAIVPPLQRFNESEYTSNGRRFILGSITFYEGQGLWAMEIAPYDTATVQMVTTAFNRVSDATYFGPVMAFHPTSVAVERTAAGLPKTVRLATTSDIYAKVDYQPLNLATSIGKLRFVRATNLTSGDYLSFREIVVLDQVPNDLSVTLGIITQEFQTPLSHINVLSQTRKIPNMALRNAFTDPKLRALEGKWVTFSVTATAFTIAEASLAQADTWWEANKPKGVTIPAMDTSVTGLVDVKTALDMSLPIRERILKKTVALGGKGTHYAAMSQVDLVPMPKPAGFIIPVYYYDQFIKVNGFDKRIDALLADPAFRDDARTRDLKLSELRFAMEEAPLDAAFESMIRSKLTAEYPDRPMRFRSSSTAEDLEGFAGAGLYTSKTGDLNDPKKTPLRAIKKVWASVWFFRGFEEREYRSVLQKSVGMAVLVHPSFPEEEASGVALTANPFDPAGQQPGFFINVQPFDESVTLPELGRRSDQFLYHPRLPGQPIIYLEHSSLIPEGTTVLNAGQVFALGEALEKIHEFFRAAYGPPASNPGGWYGLEVDFKFDGPPGEKPALFIKQARPHPGRGSP